MLAYLRNGETYTDPAIGSGMGTTTVFRYQKAVNTAHTGLRAPGERANAALKSGEIRRTIHIVCPQVGKAHCLILP